MIIISHQCMCAKPCLLIPYIAPALYLLIILIILLLSLLFNTNGTSNPLNLNKCMVLAIQLFPLRRSIRGTLLYTLRQSIVVQ
jgi:hypothetical protein